MMLKFNLQGILLLKTRNQKIVSKEINSKNIPQQLLPFFDLSNNFFIWLVIIKY